MTLPARRVGATPPARRNLTATQVQAQVTNPGEITVTWVRAPDAQSERVHYRAVGGTDQYSAVTPIGASSHALTGLQPSTYTITILSANQTDYGGTQGESRAATVTIPTPSEPTVWTPPDLLDQYNIPDQAGIPGWKSPVEDHPTTTIIMLGWSTDQETSYQALPWTPTITAQATTITITTPTRPGATTYTLNGTDNGGAIAPQNATPGIVASFQRTIAGTADHTYVFTETTDTGETSTEVTITIPA